MKISRNHVLVALVFILALATVPAAATTITIVNMDGAGEGFNDPTAAAPVGGNSGTTVGQQRLNAFQFAADRWAGLIDSDAQIFIQASFDPLTCTATSAVLGSAGAIQIFSDFTGADFAATWYQVALASKLSGSDLVPGATGTNADDIVARFNSNLNGAPTCLGGTGWYYGFDNAHGGNIDLVTVLLHEFGHGLGFANFVNETTGANIGGQTDVYSQFTRDNTLGQTWAQINPTSTANASIQASAIRCGEIAWDGSHVTTAISGESAPMGLPLLLVNTPVAITGAYQIGTAAFGPALTGTGITADVVLAVDGVGATNDACDAITNDLTGKIALVDRGTCGFTIKVKNAQNAGALAVLVADNVAGCPPPSLGGTDATITIPSARITLDTGNAIKAQLGTGVNATMRLDMTRRAGVDAGNRALLAALNPVVTGSSISHFDASHFPNRLMEPAINSDLDHTTNDVDLTFELFQDIGWFKLDGSLTQVDSADPVVAGATYSYTLSAVNGGSGTNYPVTVTDTLPPGSTFVSATGTGWSCNHVAGVVTCGRVTDPVNPDLPTGPLPVITVTVTAPLVPGLVTNAAQINVSSPLIDPDTANNAISEATNVVSPAAITATKTVSGAPFHELGAVTYTVILSNSGPAAQLDNPGDEFTDVLPAGLTLTGASATSGTAASAGNTVTWNGTVPAGGSVTITITATINIGSVLTSISNQGTVSYDADGNGTNEASALTDDPAVGGANDATVFAVESFPTIPALSTFGLLAYLMALALVAMVVVGRRTM